MSFKEETAERDLNDGVKCLYCGCDAEDHPTISVPLGAFSCCGCGGCPLLQKHVLLIAGGERQ